MKPVRLFQVLAAHPERCCFTLLLVAGIILRLEYLREFAASPLFDLALGPDVEDYYERALEILNGRLLPTVPEIHAPLYSWFLAAALRLAGPDNLPAVRLLQLVLNLGAWCWLYRLLVRIGAAPAVRLIFFGLAMLLPIPVFHQAELISESLLLPVVAAALWFLYTGEAGGRRLRFAAAGAAAGAAMLIHGLAGAFLAAELIAFALKRQWSRLGWFLLGAAVLITPLVTAKSLYYRRPTGIQDNAAFNLWLGNNGMATGGCWLRPGRKWREIHCSAEQEAGTRGISVDRLWLERAAKFWLDSPGQALRLYFRKALRICSPRELIAGADPGWLVTWTMLGLYGSFLTLPVFLAAAFGLVVLWRRRDGRFRHFYWLTGALFCAQLLTVTSGRYRLIMYAGLLVFAAVGLAAVDWRRCWWIAVLVLGLAPVAAISGAGSGKPEAASLLGEAAFRRGDDRYAESLLRYASRRIDDPARFDNLLGKIAERNGHSVRAFWHYARAATLDSRQPDGWMNLANLLAEHSWAATPAESAFRRAAALNPEAELPHFNYGLFLLRNGRPAAAASELRTALRLNPARAAAWNLLGAAMLRQGDAATAESAFARAAALAPGHPGYRANLNYVRTNFRR